MDEARDMDEVREELEKAGYSFDVAEEPVTEPESQFESYCRVTIRHRGVALGTRSEMTSERALARAYLFAEKHRQGEDVRTLMD
jgi:hypothetical protein